MSTFYILTTLLITLTTLPLITSAFPTCTSLSGTEVDWYYIIVYHNKDSSSQILMDYFDSQTTTTAIPLPSSLDTFPPFALRSHLLNSTSLSYINFNSSTSNGLFIFDNFNSSLLLVHSLETPYPLSEPHFASFSFPLTTNPHFLCITPHKQSTFSIAQTLQYININVYDSFKSEAFTYTKDTPLYNLIYNNDKAVSSPYELETNIKTYNGNTFTIFTKGANTMHNIFEYTLLRKYKSNIFIKNANRIMKDSFCYNNISEPCVYNIHSLRYNKNDEGTYDEFNDKTKWIVIENGMTCLCDIDKSIMDIVYNGNGNIYCFKNDNVYKHLYQSIETYINTMGQIEMV